MSMPEPMLEVIGMNILNEDDYRTVRWNPDLSMTEAGRLYHSAHEAFHRLREIYPDTRFDDLLVAVRLEVDMPDDLAEILETQLDFANH